MNSRPLSMSVSALAGLCLFSLPLHAAELSFDHAYEVTNEAAKEQNSHDFVYDATATACPAAGCGSLGAATIDDDKNSLLFSGNDIAAIGINIGGTTYYGWVSRPIKAGGKVKGFYFWTDVNFTDLASATADGNADGDSNVADNRGFLLVVDQAYFDGLAYSDATAKKKTVGSSSDRVDTALNAFVTTNATPVAVADSSDLTLLAGAKGGPAQESGGENNNTPGKSANGDVLQNDTDDGTLTVTKAGTSSATTLVTGTSSTNGSGNIEVTGALVVVGRYGTLYIAADGGYEYDVNESNAEVQALRQSTNTLSDVFTYEIQDAGGATAVTTLTVKITGQNDNPVAADDYNVAKESLRAPADNPAPYEATDPAGRLAVGNVLENDTDVDGFSETKSVDQLQLTGTATGSTVAVTVLSFSTLPANVAVGYFVWKANNATFAGSRALLTATNQPITVTAIDTAAKTFTLSGAVARVADANPFVSPNSSSFTLASSQTLGFSNNQNGAAYKEAQISSSENYSGTTVNFTLTDGLISPGMVVTGDGVSPGTTVVSVDHVTRTLILSQAASLTGVSLQFARTANAPVVISARY
ncbi:MAG: VCBS domain-containing protein, partial [Myxococcota bacterium]